MSEKITAMYKNRIRLENPRHVQRLLARTINYLHEGEITDNKARVVGYLCGIMLRGFETVDLQQRIEELEEYAKRGGHD